MDWTQVVTQVEAITAEVGERLLQDFGQARAMEKADGSLVTRSDQWADEALRRAIATHFPDHGVLSEEVEHIFPDTDWCWIIDPIDGTTNFARGIPLWGISLGLLYRGTPVFGHVRIPPLDHCFHGFWWGDSGLSGPTGAYLNHQLIHVSDEDPSKNHFFSLCARSTSVLQRPFPCKIRMLGVATYNLLSVATGAMIGAVEATPKIWDIAAVWAIAQGAGGSWVPLDGSIFPLEPGVDYGSRSYPTLLVNRSDLVEQFRPLVMSVAAH